uniref:Uncharacterized protein n=1 Tax=Aegilops tauschii subsp. strangulata TaxID=200361 RepID=A0A453TCT1_AEGTS
RKQRRPCFESWTFRVQVQVRQEADAHLQRKNLNHPSPTCNVVTFFKS